MIEGDIAAAILDDILRNRRSFLPGEAPSQDELRANLFGPVQIDGLSLEDCALIRSTLPSGCSSVWAAPMDKGLSGAHVLALRYEVGASRSKYFVAKIGPHEKLDREYDAVKAYAAPLLTGIEQPVYRQGPTRALLLQELRGLTKQPLSLRLFARDSPRAAAVVTRLLETQLAPWYAADERIVRKTTYDRLFRWHLRKAPPAEQVVPDDWSALTAWVSETAHLATLTSLRVGELLQDAMHAEIETAITIAHGDLHAQNVIVDETSLFSWPIDFGWCAPESSPIVDLVMLESSLKFLAIPMRADLRTLIAVEQGLSREPYPSIGLVGIPYGREIDNCLRAVAALRRYALEGPNPVEFADYRRALAIIAYCLSSHPGLNRPYVLASLQLLLAGMDTDA